MLTHRGAYQCVSDISSADCVDNDFASLGAIDRLFCGCAAGIVIAIANDDQDSGDWLRFLAAGKLVGGKGNSIPECSTAGWGKFADRACNEILVPCEILNQENGIGKTDYEGEVI